MFTTTPLEPATITDKLETECCMDTTHDAAIQKVLRRILVLNLLVAFAKLFIGFFTGAISIIADGFHSLVDGLSNVVALVAQYIAAQPPDERHPYGHRRFEFVATFIIGGFLMLVAWEVLNAAIDRLRSGEAVEVLPESFAVLIGTLGVNVFVVLYERRRGQTLKSPILLADANHTLTDVMVTCSVLVSLVLTEMGFAWADGVVALLIVVLIGWMGWEIISESANVLADAAALPAPTLEQAVSSVPNVGKVLQVRSRGAGDEVYVDVDVQVAPELTADHTYNLENAIENKIHTQFPNVKEVRVSFEPERNGPVDYALLARAIADGLGLSVHEVISIPTEKGMLLDMHVEVARGLTLASAHEKVSALENQLSERDDICEVITHIEPQNRQGAALTHSHNALAIRDQALEIARSLYANAHWHEGTIRLAEGGYALTVHCQLPGSVSLEEAHSIAEQVETRIRADMPIIQRVTIHTEPDDMIY